MIKNIKLPAPQLSQLKEVNVKLDLSGRHYIDLSAAQDEVPEDIVLSIVQSLMKEDANKLTLNELRYIFMLIKINSFENNYNVKVTCKNYDTHKKSICGAINEIKVTLADSDLNKTPYLYYILLMEMERDYLKTFHLLMTY